MSGWLAPAVGGTALAAAVGRTMVPVSRSGGRDSTTATLDLRKLVPKIRDTIADHGEHLVYRVSGLPITLRALLSTEASIAHRLRRQYARDFWSPGDIGEWFDLVIALCLWAPLLLSAVIWFTARNGRAIKCRSGRPRWQQGLDQVRLYFSAGICPPWYYIFSMEERRARADARTFLQRGETKHGVYLMLARRRRPASPLNEKDEFARHCVAHGLPHVPVLAVGRDGRLSGEVSGPESLPRVALFLKPVRNRGGKGAERWDHLGGGRYHCEVLATEVGSEGLLDRLRHHPGGRACLLQPLIRNHEAIHDLNNGALATVRMLTCLDETGNPELVGAVFRMAIGKNRTVDNLHAGGIVANVDMVTGILGSATDLGMDARLGWLDCHPNSGAPILCRQLPLWDEAVRLSLHAHRSFRDHVFVGWDVALTPDGPLLVEGNCGPDLDVMQRPARAGMANGRFAELLCHHLCTT